MLIDYKFDLLKSSKVLQIATLLFVGIKSNPAGVGLFILLLTDYSASLLRFLYFYCFTVWFWPERLSDISTLRCSQSIKPFGGRSLYSDMVVQILVDHSKRFTNTCHIHPLFYAFIHRWTHRGATWGSVSCSRTPRKAARGSRTLWLVGDCSSSWATAALCVLCVCWNRNRVYPFVTEKGL